MNAILMAIQILVTMLVGVIAKKLKVVGDDFRSKLSPFLLDICIPCLIVNSFINLEFDEEHFKSGLTLMLVAVLVVVILYIVGFVFKLVCKDKVFGAIGHYSIIFSNFTFMGIPVVQGLYGDEGVFFYMMFLMPIRVLYYVLMPFVLAPPNNRHVSVKDIAKIFVSVPMIALYLALFLYLTQIKLPTFIAKPLGNISTLVSTMGIILIGVSLADVDFKEVFSKSENIIMPIFNVIIAPVAVLAVLTLLFGETMPHISLAVCVIYAALPTATMVPIWAAKYYDEERPIKLASVGIVVSTLVSVATLPVIAILIEKVLF